MVAGYRVHKSGADAIGSLLLGLCKDDSTLASVGVIGAFPMAKRQQLFTALQPLVTTFDDHPWNCAVRLIGERFRHTAQFNRWRPDRDPRSCTYAQLEHRSRSALATSFQASDWVMAESRPALSRT